MVFMINKLANLLVEAIDEKLYDKGFSATVDYGSKTVREKNNEEVVLSLVYRG